MRKRRTKKKKKKTSYAAMRSAILCVRLSASYKEHEMTRARGEREKWEREREEGEGKERRAIEEERRARGESHAVTPVADPAIAHRCTRDRALKIMQVSQLVSMA